MSRLFSGQNYSRKERTYEKQNYKSKAYIAFEGSKTEPNYFSKILKKFDIKNDLSVELHIARRCKRDGRSNPKNVRDDLKEYYNEKLKDSFISGDSLWIVIDVDKHFESKRRLKKDNYLLFENSLFTKDGNKINVVLSNPCFELWLILQYRKPDDLDLIKIKQNNKTKNKTYTKTLHKKLQTEFSNIDFKTKMLNAITNSKSDKLSSENIDIIDYIGTSVVHLIEFIFEESAINTI